MSQRLEPRSLKLLKISHHLSQFKTTVLLLSVFKNRSSSGEVPPGSLNLVQKRNQPLPSEDYSFPPSVVRRYYPPPPSIAFLLPLYPFPCACSTLLPFVFRLSLFFFLLVMSIQNPAYSAKKVLKGLLYSS